VPELVEAKMGVPQVVVEVAILISCVEQLAIAVHGLFKASFLVGLIGLKKAFLPSVDFGFTPPPDKAQDCEEPRGDAKRP
jgi:hypothetical protein